jgi:hydroxymethylbilane synthase
VTAERAFLAHLGGGCQVPIAGHATLARGEITVEGLVAWPDGSGIVRGRRAGAAADGEALGRALAEDLLSRGADRILEVLQDSREGPPGGGP